MKLIIRAEKELLNQSNITSNEVCMCGTVFKRLISLIDFDFFLIPLLLFRSFACLLGMITRTLLNSLLMMLFSVVTYGQTNTKVIAIKK
jgi:hypothetical protein